MPSASVFEEVVPAYQAPPSQAFHAVSVSTLSETADVAAAAVPSYRRFSTSDLPHWQGAVLAEFFEMKVETESECCMSAHLDTWDLKPAQLSLLHTRGLLYVRLAEHCKGKDRQVLVLSPTAGELHFTMAGQRRVCTSGEFVVISNDEPFELASITSCEVWCVKFSAEALTARAGDVRRFYGRQFGAQNHAAGAFMEYLHLALRHCLAARKRSLLMLMGSQLLDLLAAACREHPDVLQSSQSSVRSLHLGRIEAYVRTHLSDSELSPARIANACKISLRYLHLLFKETGQSISQWIREQRLQAAYEILSNASGTKSVAQIAYAVGFGDQAQFSHAFRRRFGHPPSELLRGAYSRHAGTSQARKA